MLNTIFAVMLSALHLMYSAWKIIRDSWNGTVHQFKSAIKRYSYEDELKFISSYVKRLDKLPAHLAIIIVNEKISYNDLANIIMWCVAARISFVSLYDHTGVLKNNEAKLHSALLGKWKEPPVIWGKTQAKNGVLKENGYSNGLSPNAGRVKGDWTALQVLVLSPNEGREAFTAATRRICEDVQYGKLEVSSIDENFMERKLKLGSKEQPVVDPELAVWCGKCCCNCGYLPWHIRVTQFLHLHTHHNIRYKDFISVLETYSKCEQRHGK